MNFKYTRQRISRNNQKGMRNRHGNKCEMNINVSQTY